MSELSAPLREAFAARARGEVDFIFTIARATEARWEDALGAYLAALKGAGEAALQRIAEARNKRGAPR